MHAPHRGPRALSSTWSRRSLLGAAALGLGTAVSRPAGIAGQVARLLQAGSDPHALATAAYIYGYPFVYSLSEVASQTSDPKLRTGRPVNIFGHAANLSVPEEKFVSVNNDTLYSIAHCDVTDEPLVLNLPDTGERYYVMQLIDAWTNNFAYIGRRASGTQQTVCLLAGPEWQGSAPDGLQLIQAPTNVFSIIGRYAVDGHDDIPNVTALQEQTWLTPLSLYPDQPDTLTRELGDREVAPYDVTVSDDLVFWEQFRSWLALYPPPDAEREFLQTLAPLGLLDAESPYRDPAPELAGVLAAAAEAGRQAIEQVMTEGTTLVNGWTVGLHGFDYNVHNLGPGTVDAPEWRIDDRPRAFLTRAVAARAGLWGNHGYEAAYYTAYVDDTGAALHGASSYVIHFPTPPPVEAFWSITMYDDEDFYLVENPIDRYSIGDRTPTLTYNDDGSLDIYIQHESPGPDLEGNWLPAPAGGFRPVMRAYQPAAPILDGNFTVPAIQKQESAPAGS